MHIETDVVETDYGQMSVFLHHEPTGSTVCSTCAPADVDELKEILHEEIMEMIEECENWLH